MVHAHTIPDSYYVPDGQVRLLSPQHWMQKTMTKQERRDHSHSCTTKHDHILLTWKDKFVQTIPLDQSNVGTFTLALGYKNFKAFAAKAHIIPDDEDDHPILLTKGGEHVDLKCIPDYNEPPLKEHPLQVDFDLQGPPSSEQQFTHKLVEVEPTDAYTEFLCYHQQYGHVSPKKIQAMAKRGILPRCLATCPIPNC